MEIRLAVLQDIDDILNIVSDAKKLLKDNKVNQWQNGYPNKDTFLSDIENDSLYVAIDNDKVVGIAYFGITNEPSYKNIYQGEWLTKNETYLVIHRLAARGDYYNHGVAKSIFAYAKHYAILNKLNSIRVDTHPNNYIMKRLLKKNGFKKCEIIYLKGYTDNDNLRIAYEKVISER